LTKRSACLDRVLAVGALLLGLGFTVWVTWAGWSGAGLNDVWAQGVSLRTGSAGGVGRTYVGGGVSGGK